MSQSLGMGQGQDIGGKIGGVWGQKNEKSLLYRGLRLNQVGLLCQQKKPQYDWGFF